MDGWRQEKGPRSVLGDCTQVGEEQEGGVGVCGTNPFILCCRDRSVECLSSAAWWEAWHLEKPDRNKFGEGGKGICLAYVFDIHTPFSPPSEHYYECSLDAEVGVSPGVTLKKTKQTKLEIWKSI